MDEVKEFVADTRDAAVEMAAGFFGVPKDRLWIHVVPEVPIVSGLGGRTLLLAAVNEDAPEAAPVDLGPIGSFVAELLQHMGVSGVRLTESVEESGDIVVTMRGNSVLQLDASDRHVLPSISHIAERAAEKLLDGPTARVELEQSGRPAQERRPERESRDRDRGERGERGGRGRRERGGRADRGDRGDRGDRPPRPDADEEALELLAREAAAKVRESGSPEILRAMNSRERWVVHNALADEKGVRSESEGEGRTRRVKLVPGVSPATAAPPRIDDFLRELSRWAGRMNLVGSTEPAALSEHVQDSLAAADQLPASARVVDLGSGAGFPGIPIALARPDLALTLVEIREKRVSFLRHAVRTLDLQCEVRRASIDEPPPERFDRALLRAVASPEQSLARAEAWVTPGGEIWIWAGPEAQIPEDRLLGRISLAPRGEILRLRV